MKKLNFVIKSTSPKYGAILKDFFLEYFPNHSESINQIDFSIVEFREGILAYYGFIDGVFNSYSILQFNNQTEIISLSVAARKFISDPEDLLDNITNISVQKYEYKSDYKTDIGCSSLGSVFEMKYLKEMGDLGWELVTILERGYGSSHMYYWKRLK